MMKIDSVNRFNAFFYVKFQFLVIAVGILIGISGCSTSSESIQCDRSSSILIGLESCLRFEEQGQLDSYRDEIIPVIRKTFSEVNELMPVKEVLIRILVAPQNVIPELGINGYNPNENEVIIHTDPNSSIFPQSLGNDLATILSHELHHVKRRRTTGYGSTLLQALISEGLADHFSVEVTQADPPIWSQVLTDNQLDSLIQKARQNWNAGVYDHNAWFFGTTKDIPRWAGYSIGFELVQIYLLNHPERKASNLFGEPASSFIPE